MKKLTDKCIESIDSKFENIQIPVENIEFLSIKELSTIYGGDAGSDDDEDGEREGHG